jgi:putative glutamine amidotransferase
MRIALTYTGSEAKHDNYKRYLLSTEAFEVLRFSVGEQKIEELDQCDGLVLSGGIDIHPSYYHGALQYPNADEFNQARDAFEIDLFERALKRGIPVLGICRGQQLVNTVLGGTLIQDMGACLNKIHRVASGVPDHLMSDEPSPAPALHLDKIHGVRVVPGTLLAEIAGGSGSAGTVYRGAVNSAHHQSLDLVAPDLKVNVYADDGTIEGVEWADPSGKPWLLCVQWHPERMFVAGLETQPLSKAVRDRFMEEVKKAKKSI